MFLIDAMAMAFRNFHAFGARPLTTPDGTPISAVFGSAVYLLKLMAEEKPDFLAVITDTKEKTFRHEMYPQYKANRTEMPEDLVKQLPLFRQLFECFDIPYLFYKGYEADDIIGTFARRYASDDCEVYIVSGDKDFMQLVNDNVKLYTPRKGGESEIIDREGVLNKFGVAPEQVVDALALIGDSADNVPGVLGIGEKGAAKLIQKFGSLAGIYQHIEELPPNKQREALATQRDQAYLAQKLLRIHTDVPLEISIEALKFDLAQSLRGEALDPYFERLAFRRLQAQLEELRNKNPTSSYPNSELAITSSSRGDTHYRLIQTKGDLAALVQSLAIERILAFDTETTGLDGVSDIPIGISLSWAQGQAAYIPIESHDCPMTLAEIKLLLQPLLQSPTLLKVAHNAKFDLKMLWNLGFTVQGPIADTFLMAYLLNPIEKGHGLDELSLRHLGIKKIPTAHLIGKDGKASMRDVGLELLTDYACEDADCTLRLFHYLQPILKAQEIWQVAEQIEFPLIPVLAQMEQTGCYINASYLRNLALAINEDLKKLEKTIWELAGEPFNIHSTKQLQHILFEKLKIHDQLKVKAIKKTKSGYSTDVSVLEKLAEHPLPEQILQYRGLAKLKNTYVDVLPELINAKTGRVHTTFNQAGTATGRLSSSDPNLQNIPIRSAVGKMIREAFHAQFNQDHILSADYSQIELRLLAHMSQDPYLIEAFQNGADIHRATAARIFAVPEQEVDGEMRSRAKAINFGIIYGMGPARLAREIKVPFAEARAFIERYFATYPNIQTFAEERKAFAKSHHFSQTITGRRRPIPEFESDNPGLIANAENIAVNSPIQGSAADLIKMAMIKIHKQLQSQPLRAKMLLQVHDELVFECHTDDLDQLKDLVRKSMAEAMSLSVPLRVDIGTGKNWLEAHS
jgi:DNA polymerase-1